MKKFDDSFDSKAGRRSEGLRIPVSKKAAPSDQQDHIRTSRSFRREQAYLEFAKTHKMIDERYDEADKYLG